MRVLSTQLYDIANTTITLTSGVWALNYYATEFEEYLDGAQNKLRLLADGISATKLNSASCGMIGLEIAGGNLGVRIAAGANALQLVAAGGGATALKVQVAANGGLGVNGSNELIFNAGPSLSVVAGTVNVAVAPQGGIQVGGSGLELVSSPVVLGLADGTYLMTMAKVGAAITYGALNSAYYSFTVGCTGADTTPNHLYSKITAGAAIQKVLLNPAGNESVRIQLVYNATNFAISGINELYIKAGGVGTTELADDSVTVGKLAHNIDATAIGFDADKVDGHDVTSVWPPTTDDIWDSADTMTHIIQHGDSYEEVIEFASPAAISGPLVDGYRMVSTATLAEPVSGQLMTADYIYEYVLLTNTWLEYVPVHGKYITRTDTDENLYWDGAAWVNAAVGLDHGALGGLGDDDHIQYILVAGTRAFTGSQSMGGFELTNVATSVTNVRSAANRSYVDATSVVIDQINFVVAEPGAPTVGDTYINTTTGVMSGTAQACTATHIYIWNGTTWDDITPYLGWTVYDQTSLVDYRFDGAAWNAVPDAVNFVTVGPTGTYTTLGAAMLSGEQFIQIIGPTVEVAPAIAATFTTIIGCGASGVVDMHTNPGIALTFAAGCNISNVEFTHNAGGAGIFGITVGGVIEKSLIQNCTCYTKDVAPAGNGGFILVLDTIHVSIRDITWKFDVDVTQYYFITGTIPIAAIDGLVIDSIKYVNLSGAVATNIGVVDISGPAVFNIRNIYPQDALSFVGAGRITTTNAIRVNSCVNSVIDNIADLGIDFIGVSSSTAIQNCNYIGLTYTAACVDFTVNNCIIGPAAGSFVDNAANTSIKYTNCTWDMVTMSVLSVDTQFTGCKWGGMANAAGDLQLNSAYGIFISDFLITQDLLLSTFGGIDFEEYQFSNGHVGRDIVVSDTGLTPPVNIIFTNISVSRDFTFSSIGPNAATETSISSCIVGNNFTLGTVAGVGVMTGIMVCNCLITGATLIDAGLTGLYTGSLSNCRVSVGGIVNNSPLGFQTAINV